MGLKDKARSISKTFILRILVEWWHIFPLYHAVKERIQKIKHNQITGPIIGAAIDVHRHLVPGLLESACEECLVYEFNNPSLHVVR